MHRFLVTGRRSGRAVAVWLLVVQQRFFLG